MTTKPTWEMDAGELRTYVVERHGQALLHGGLNGRHSRAIRWVERLARAAGQAFEDVLADLRADAELRFA